MTTTVEPRRVPGIVSETAQRRWRLAALLGLVILLTLVAFLIVQAEQNAQSSRMVPVLRATRDIQAGTPITDDELGTTYVRVDDASVLATLVNAADRSRLIGQVAINGVRAGSLIPAGLGTPRASYGLWEVPLSVKQMPPDLKAGDHVALLVGGTGKTGQPEELVAAQDVRVQSVEQGAIVVWLPSSAAAQMELYASHGDVVAARMQPGAVQKNSTPAGES